MSNFPLYNSIVEQLDANTLDQPITNNQKIEFVEFIKLSDNNTHELVYILLKIHQIRTELSSKTSLPFNGKEQKAGLKFDIDNCPNKLQNILYKFMQMTNTANE